MKTRQTNHQNHWNPLEGVVAEREVAAERGEEGVFPVVGVSLYPG